MFLISPILYNEILKNNVGLYNNVGLLQHWLAFAVNSASDANTDMEKRERKGSIHSLVQDCMIYF